MTDYNLCSGLAQIGNDIIDCGDGSTSYFKGNYIDVVKNIASTLDQAFTSGTLGTRLRENKLTYDKKLGFDPTIPFPFPTDKAELENLYSSTDRLIL